MKHFIYMTINKVNGKKYIGKHSGDVDDDYCGSGIVLRAAIKKHGKENFHREILAITEDIDMLDVLEKHYIEKYDAVDNPQFYNLADGGTGGNTLKHLPKERLMERSQKIKEYFAGLSEEEKIEIYNNRSKEMKRVRKDTQAEQERIKKLKSTHYNKSPDRIKEEYKTRSGGHAYCAKSVQTPAGIFSCATEAAITHNVCTQTVLNRCKNPDFIDWKFLEDK